MSKDQLYQRPNSTHIGSFKFDDKVADVFADMIARSVPGYEQILSMLPTLVKQQEKARSNTSKNLNYYDLGCSLGAGILAMAAGLENKTSNKHRLIGIDNSAAMLQQAQSHLENMPNCYLLEQDLQHTNIESAAMVLMNFTLQFIPLAERNALIAKIYAGLIDGGVLILSEKIKFESAKTNDTLIDIHHQYKADQGYSELEIAQKRDAIENVLIPETLDVHTERLTQAGFCVVTPWVQNLQFISILAIK